MTTVISLQVKDKNHFLHACNTLRHRQETAQNISVFWLVEIARGVLLTFFIMRG